MISQGQSVRQHDSSGKSVVQQSNSLHLHESNMEENIRMEAKIVDDQSVGSTVGDNCVVPNSKHVAVDVAGRDDDHQHDFPTTSDAVHQNTVESDMNMATVGMSDNILDGTNRGIITGMRTRGNRRPIMTERMRQKRQTLQDMAKPLKAWLYEHRDNPYPTKTEKALLAVGSQMTLVQVSNWFANARRRLKNTVRHPGLTWSKRIKMYNSHVTGNAERLSICSSVSSISDFAFEAELHGADDMPQLNCYETVSCYSSRPPSTTSQDAHMHMAAQNLPDSPHHEGAQHKSEHSILNRYLNDSFEHAQRYQQHHHHHQNTESSARRRNGSGTGSVSSHDYEDVSLSRLSPQSEQTDHRDHQGSASDVFDDFSRGDQNGTIRSRIDSSLLSKEEEDTYWKEINAALALTNMARACRQPEQPLVSCFR